MVGLIYVRFLLALPASERRGLLGAALVFLAGALGVEMIGGMYLEAHDGGVKAAPYVVLVHVEELLEMSGVLILLHVLLRRFADRVSLTVMFVGEARRAATPAAAGSRAGLPAPAMRPPIDGGEGSQGLAPQP